MKILPFCFHLALAGLLYATWIFLANDNNWFFIAATVGVVWAVYHDLYTPLRRK
jgi:hypothetical protein